MRGALQVEIESGQDLALGAYLEHIRIDAGLTMRQLAAATDIPLTTLNRLLKDEVVKPSPAHLARIAAALELDPADVFMVAGLPLPKSLPSVDVVLRAEYGLSDAGLAEAKRFITEIADRERTQERQDD